MNCHTLQCLSPQRLLVLPSGGSWHQRPSRWVSGQSLNRSCYVHSCASWATCCSTARAIFPKAAYDRGCASIVTCRSSHLFAATVDANKEQCCRAGRHQSVGIDPPTAPSSLTSSHLSPALLLASAHIFQTGARKRGNCELAHLFSRSIGLVPFPMALFPVVVFGDGKVLLLAAQC